MGKLTGKVIAVTGASSGIGAELALQLSRLGAIPILIARRADKLADVSGQLSGEHWTIQADVTDNEQIVTAVEQIMSRYGRIDGWVNNAGVGAFESFLTAPLEQFERLMDVNYMSIVRCTKAVLPHMLATRAGRIINVVSVAGKIGTAKATGYSASKHAALGFTTSLRAELTGTGVQVCTVNPGPIDTPFFDLADPSGDYKRNVEWFMLKPGQVAAVICRVLESGKLDVTLPMTASLGAKLMHVFPNILSGVAAKLLNKK